MHSYNRDAYMNVARVLKKMKNYAEGKELIAALLKNYRAVYKKIKNMKELMRACGGFM